MSRRLRAAHIATLISTILPTIAAGLAALAASAGFASPALAQNPGGALRIGLVTDMSGGLFRYFRQGPRRGDQDGHRRFRRIGAGQKN